MKKLLVSFALILISLNINATISQSGITNLKQLDKNGIIDLVSGNQLTGFISDGPYEGPIKQTYFKDGRYETIYDDRVFKGKWRAEGESYATPQGKKMCTKNNNVTDWTCFYWYKGNKDGATYAYIIAQGKIFHQYHKIQSVVQINQEKKKAEDRKKAAERKRIADAKKVADKKKAAERQRIADAKKVADKKKAAERQRIADAKRVAEEELNKKLALIPPETALEKAQNFIYDLEEFVGKNPEEFDIIEIAMFTINTKQILEGVMNDEQINTLESFKEYVTKSIAFKEFQTRRQDTRNLIEVKKINVVINDLRRSIKLLISFSKENLTSTSIRLIDEKNKSSQLIINNYKAVSELENKNKELTTFLMYLKTESREAIAAKKTAKKKKAEEKALKKDIDIELTKIDQHINKLTTYLAENLSSLSAEIMDLTVKKITVLKTTKNKDLKELKKTNQAISNFILENNIVTKLDIVKEKKKVEDRKKAVERQRIADAKKVADKKKAAERQRIADAKKVADKKKAAERQRIADAKNVADKKKAAERQRIADAKNVADKKKALERKRIADAKKVEKARYASYTYFRVNNDVGCGSTYSKERRNDIFNSKYKGRWMKWRGEIVIVSSDKVSLNVDNRGTQDLSVSFAKPGAGYNLREGQFITVRFSMKSTGGCFLPFGGEKATIVN